MIKTFQNSLIYFFLYIPPLIFFIKSSVSRKVNKLLLFSIGVFYLIIAFYTQNLLPFVLVLMNIRYIKNNAVNLMDSDYTNHDNVSDYYRFNFNIKSFKLFKGLTYAIESYGICIFINILITLLISLLKVNLSEQEIVRQLLQGSLNQIIYMVPVMLIFAPVVEEFTFRWLLFEKVFKPRIGITMSAIISSLMFALVHFNLRSFPVLITVGIVNCYLIHKKGYWYAVFNHLIFNSVSTIMMIVQKIS